jgi:hypothetical protein
MLQIGAYLTTPRHSPTKLPLTAQSVLSPTHASTSRPGTRANSRTLPVTIVSPCARQVAASHRSCGPISWPSAISPDHKSRVRAGRSQIDWKQRKALEHCLHEGRAPLANVRIHGSMNAVEQFASGDDRQEEFLFLPTCEVRFQTYVSAFVPDQDAGVYQDTQESRTFIVSSSDLAEIKS